MRTSSALALGLCLIDLSTARVTTGTVQERKEESDAGFMGWFNRLFNRDVEQRAALDTCVIDSYYDFVDNSTFGSNFCQDLMNYPNVTVVQNFQPLSTVTDKFSTQSGTVYTTIHTTPVTTATITGQPSPGTKRDFVPNNLIGKVFLAYRQVAEANGTAAPGDAVMSAAFVSACNCQPYAGSTVVSTKTLDPLVATVSAYERVITTVATTRTEPTSTVYTTVSAAQSPAVGEAPAGGEGPADVPSMGGSQTTAAQSAGPTAPVFSCPADDKSIVNQLVGALRYDYLILCDTDLTGGDVYDQLSYGTYSECAAACSVGDTALGQPICEGFVFYNTRDSNNCFLKNTTGTTVPAPGVDSGLLQAVAQGISEGSPQGSTTERAPFQESATIPASEISSSLASVLSNSTTSIAVITPAPSLVQSGRLPAAAGVTDYSTYVSNGETFSTGTVYSTYHSESGTWYYSYYTSFSQAWSSATTVYASSETSAAISNSTNTENTVQSGNNGEYYVISASNSTAYFPGGYNVTEVIGNATYDANNNQISSTATTNYFTYQTAGAGGDSGGGNGGNAAGIITSTFPAATSTSLSSGVSVIVSNGQTMYVTYGGGSGTVQQTSGPNVRPSVILNTYGTAWSSGYVASGVYGQGGAGGAGGASGAGSSGIVSPTPISSTVISGAASGQSGTALSGIVSSAPLSPIFSTIVSTGISGESSTEGSGSNAPFSNSIDSRYGTLAPSSEITPTPIFSTALSTEINGASSTKGSGSVPPFSSSIKSRSGSLPPLSGFQSSGSVRLSTGPSSAPFTNSINSRSGSLPPSGTGSIPLSTAFVPTSSPLSGVPFTNSLNSRSGSLPPPSSAPSGTGFSPSSSWGTGSSFFSTGFTAPYVTGTLLSAPPGDFTESIPFSIPTGYLPSNSLPGTGSLGVPFTNSINSRSGSLPPSGTARPTTGSMPTGGVPLSIAPSSGLPFTNSINSRSGTLPTSSGAVPSSTGTSPATSPLTTFPPYPTAASSCVTNFLGTTTIFTTVTSFGCYANCPAGGGGGYGNNVNTFGPPTFGGQGGWGP